MINVNTHNNIFNYLYIFVFDILIFYYVISYSEIGNKFPHGIITVACILGALVKICHDHHSSAQLLIISLLILVAVISSFCAHNLIILTDVFMIMAAKNVNYRKLIKSFFYTGLCTTVFIMFLAIIKIIPNLVYLRGSSIRQCLGFTFPNYLSEMIFILSIAYCIVYLRKTSWIQIIIFILLTYFEIRVPNTRMDFYCMSLLTIILIIKKVFPKIIYKIPFKWAWLMLPIMFFMSFYYGYNYSPTKKSMYIMDKYLEHRIYYSYIALKNDGISLFGHQIYENPDTKGGNPFQYFYVDQSAIRLAVIYGSIITILFLFIYTYKMFRLSLFGMDYLVLLFAIVVIRGFSDSNLINILGNPFLVILLANVGDFMKFSYSSRNMDKSNE